MLGSQLAAVLSPNPHISGDFIAAVLVCMFWAGFGYAHLCEQWAQAKHRLPANSDRQRVD